MDQNGVKTQTGRFKTPAREHKTIMHCFLLPTSSRQTTQIIKFLLVLQYLFANAAIKDNNNI